MYIIIGWEPVDSHWFRVVGWPQFDHQDEAQDYIDNLGPIPKSNFTCAILYTWEGVN